MASFASSATSGGARKHAWTNYLPGYSGCGIKVSEVWITLHSHSYSNGVWLSLAVTILSLLSFIALSTHFIIYSIIPDPGSLACQPSQTFSGFCMRSKRRASKL